MREFIHSFAADTRLHIALLLILLDFVLGVLAAYKLGTFRMSYLADFFRNDIAFKVFPWFILYCMAKVAGQEALVIPGLDLQVIEYAAYGVLVIAWVGSILNSLAEFGLAQGRSQSVREAVFGGEYTTEVPLPDRR